MRKEKRLILEQLRTEAREVEQIMQAAEKYLQMIGRLLSQESAFFSESFMRSGAVIDLTGGAGTESLAEASGFHRPPAAIGSLQRER